MYKAYLNDLRCCGCCHHHCYIDNVSVIVRCHLLQAMFIGISNETLYSLYWNKRIKICNDILLQILFNKYVIHQNWNSLHLNSVLIYLECTMKMCVLIMVSDISRDLEVVLLIINIRQTSFLHLFLLNIIMNILHVRRYILSKIFYPIVETLSIRQRLYDMTRIRWPIREDKIKD